MDFKWSWRREVFRAAHLAKIVQPPLPRRLREKIRAHGPLTWREWMTACLYDPQDGFYVQAKHPAGLGRGTHFATSPTIHPFFSYCVARELAAAWKAAGQPKQWEVVEFGAGTGALAQDAMQELRRLKVPARWTAIDVKPGPAIKGGRWLAKPPASYDAVVANEFLDALPFDMYEWAGVTWQDLGVDLEGEQFVWRWMGDSRIQFPPGTEANERRIVMDANQPWLASIKASGAKVAIVIDYGAPSPAKDVRAFHVHDFIDPLSEPGTVDLTADVDFQELGEQAVELGFRMELETQERFLLRHDVFTVLNKFDRTTRAGTSDYLRLRQLLLPTGFGTAFMVAILRPVT